MHTSALRKILCSRQNAERLAYRIFEATGENVTVIHQACDIQPYRVDQGIVDDTDTIAMQLRTA